MKFELILCFRADLYDDEIIQNLLQYNAPWSDQLKTIDLGASVDETGTQVRPDSAQI